MSRNRYQDFRQFLTLTNDSDATAVSDQAEASSRENSSHHISSVSNDGADEKDNDSSSCESNSSESSSPPTIAGAKAAAGKPTSAKTTSAKPSSAKAAGAKSSATKKKEDKVKPIQYTPTDAKLRDLFNLINCQLIDLWIPGKYISVDEMTLPNKSRLKFNQYNNSALWNFAFRSGFVTVFL